MVYSVAFSHDSAQLASASYDDTVKIWDASSGEYLQTLEGHRHSVHSVAFSHDSAQLASASYDKTVKIWDASSGECLQTLEIGQPLFNISFDTTGSYLHTDIGTITIDTLALNINSSVTDPQNPRCQGGALSSNGSWIKYNSENLVWLPSEYRPSCLAVSGKTIGVGVGSGKVWICNFKVDDSKIVRSIYKEVTN
jgi:WD40 repeat protein